MPGELIFWSSPSPSWSPYVWLHLELWFSIPGPAPTGAAPGMVYVGPLPSRPRRLEEWSPLLRYTYPVPGHRDALTCSMSSILHTANCCTTISYIHNSSYIEQLLPCLHFASRLANLPCLLSSVLGRLMTEYYNQNHRHFTLCASSLIGNGA